MNAFPWARRPAPSRTVELPTDRPLYILSDVHLGDGTRSDAFVGKDRELLEFLAKVREDGAHLVIAGDIIDFSQALTFTRVLRAHGDVMRRLSEMAGEAGVTYIWGNHDYDMALYRDLLRWDVCSAVKLGEEALLVHGHQLDPYIAHNLRESGVTTTVHHQVERVLGTWIRLPLQDFYTVAGRLAFWAAWHWTQLLRPLHDLLTALGFPQRKQAHEAYMQYWIQAQVGNPMNLWPQVERQVRGGRFRVLVCGHSHLPGQVRFDGGRTFVNTGSWTFRCTNYVHWDGERFEVRDWASGRVVGDEYYRPLRAGLVQRVTFDQWWKKEYRGFFRFRCGEAARRGLPVSTWYLDEPDGSSEPPAPREGGPT
ncbi:MAG: UDP-2,3-diacylglucosamine diphosphatase [Pseudomonadota bacterium]